MVKKTLLLLIFLTISTVSNSQSSNKTFVKTSDPNIFTNNDGGTIEYLGLKNWTAEEVQDSLKSLAPDRPVHACMAVLTGTSLPNFLNTLAILTKTKISDDLAPVILTDNIFLLQSHLKANHKGTIEKVLPFVNQISNKSFGDAESALVWLENFK